MQRATIRTVRCVIAASLALCAGRAMGQTITYSVVARSGDTPPGLIAGATYDSASLTAWWPAMNSNGGVSFRSALTGTGVTAANDASLWTGTVDGPVLLAREGSPATEVGPGIIYGAVGFGMPSPAMATNGKVAFRTEIAGTGVTASNNSAILGGMPGSLTLAARTGLGAPGIGLPWAGIGLPSTNQYGQVAFSGFADMGGGLTKSGLWFGVPGSVLSLMIQDSVSIVGPGTYWGAPTVGGGVPDVQINSAGQVVFRDNIYGPGLVGAANDDTLVGGSPGSLHLIARAGDPVADAPAGQWWNVFEAPTLTDDGAVAFRAFVGGPGVGGGNDFGLWRGYILGVLDCFAREGDGVPGAPLGTTFSNLTGTFGAPRMNDANQCAFGATIAGASVTAATDTGIWAHNDIGALVLVAREGSVAPDSGGAVFTGFGAEGPVLNALGQVVFRSTLSTPPGAFGVFATDPYGVMHRVTGGTSGPGMTCTPNAVSIVGQGVEDGLATQFADDGRLLLRGTCNFTPAIFVADVNNVCRPVISDHPDAQTAPIGSSMSMSVAASGPGTLIYQWRLDGVVLTNGPQTLGAVISGATAPTLSISGIHAGFAGSYDCIVSNLCKAVPSTTAALTVEACDGIDFNADGLFPDTADIDDFLSVFSGGPCSTGTCGDIDFNNDGLFPDTADIDSLLSVFSGGPCL